MTEQPHLLVVDDDTRLRKLLTKYLSDHGYLVSTAAHAAEAREQLGALSFDLIVLDLMMPGENGLDLTRSLRTQGQSVPILLLTAMGETEQRISGLEAGADDYLTKPFEPRELLLRITGILRRTTTPRPPSAPVNPVIKLGRFSFDPQRGELREGVMVVHLTTAEQMLLTVLAAHLGEPVSRDDLADQSGGDAASRAVDVQVTRLRKKIEDDPRFPRYLQTVRGQGYVLWPDPDLP